MAAELLMQKGARQLGPFPRWLATARRCGVVGKLGKAQPREETHT